MTFNAERLCVLAESLLMAMIINLSALELEGRRLNLLPANNLFTPTERSVIATCLRYS